jgi:ribose 5-phosphate isomerase A
MRDPAQTDDAGGRSESTRAGALSPDEQKRAAGTAAADLVQSGMRVGFGTGSTAVHFTLGVARRIREGTLDSVYAVPTSRTTAELLLENGIAPEDLDGGLDLAVDGADEVGPGKALIKGGGGALIREKIVAAAADRFVVIVDSSKVVERLGEGFDLPVEVARFGTGVTLQILQSFGDARLRGDSRPYVTDNGNYIVDIATGGIDDPLGLDAALNRIPSVFGTGLFVGMVDDLIVGTPRGPRHESAAR